jgi:transposase
LTGRVFDTLKHSNIKKKAEYRRIHKNTKSLKKYKAEKARRKKIVELQNQGLTIKQIAAQLKVSERTVNRDLARNMSYFKKKMTQMARKEDQEFMTRLNQMTLKEQLKIIENYGKFRQRLRKMSERKTLQITINLDSIFAGKYGVKFSPDLPINILENGKITLHLETGGKSQAIARIYVGKIFQGSANLQTNQSMNVFIEPVLKGLTVTDPKTASTP